MIGSIASVLSAFPHELAYFNEAAGGPNCGHRHLLHSNLDWGQDLLFAKEWYDEHGSGLPLYFFHYKYGNPIDIGLPVRSPNLNDSSGAERASLLPGYHLVSLQCYCGGEAYIVDGRGGRLRASGRDVHPYHSLTPVCRAGKSLLIFSAVPSSR